MTTFSPGLAARAACLALLVAAGAAQAAYKCVSPAGRVTYSEQPCVAGSQSQGIGGAAAVPSPAAPAPSSGARGEGTATAPSKAARPAPRAPAMGGTRTVPPVELRYVDVQGRDLEGLQAALKGRGLHPEVEYSLTYSYRIKPAGKACSVAELDTTLKTAITVPRWTPPQGTNPAVVREWTRFVGAHRRHAEGHLAIAREFHEIFRNSVAVTQQRCEKLDAAIKAQHAELVERYRGRQKEYDFETASGRTEGVELVQR